MIDNPPRQMRRVAAHQNFAVSDGDGRCGPLARSADAVRDTEDRDDRAVRETQRRRHRRDPRRDPAAMASDKGDCGLRGKSSRQNQLYPARRGIDTQ